MVVVDFEATCEDKRSEEFPHEIIEFPAILVDVVRYEILKRVPIHDVPSRLLFS